MTATNPPPASENARQSLLASFKGIETPIMGIFIILLLQTLVWASDFLIPVTAAVLGFFVLNRPRRWLSDFGIAPGISAALFTAILAVSIALLLLQLSGPMGQFVEDLPAMIDQIKASTLLSGDTMQAIENATEAAEEIVSDQEITPVAVEVVSDSGYATTLFSMIPGLLSRIGFSLLLLFFLVSSGDMFLSKIVESFDRFGDKRRAVDVLHAVEDRLGYYLGGITLINAGLGAAVALAMYFWGVPNAIILGVMAFGLNFVPFLGGVLGAVVAAIVAFVSLGGVLPAVGVFATYVTLTSIEGQLITPLIISRRMRLNTTVVFLSVAFFAWIWSIMGMVVALPILIVIKIICDEVEPLQTLGRFLGDVEDTSAGK